ncbi:YdcF family protein [Gordonia alkaliphila]|uniref:YdcF family protein n=1 Tax=Gordonia alkaliphila TaxID=1053547 RepID=UPI001FF17458|nr:YdcF family protein [Gordonia alkaliphila]MCK0438081.1 YdcF family protein [Gordonia alkaliphila]
MRKFFVTLAVGLASAMCLFIAAGYQVCVRDHSDPLRRVDAIVVLGGEHDGREAYALRLAREGYADTVVVSDPYWPREPDDEYLDGLCAGAEPAVEIVCFRPEPSSTRGEARFIAALADERGWSSLIVVSWGHHLVRARYILSRCFDGQTVMRAMPRQGGYGPVRWARIFNHQLGGFVEARVKGC